LSDIAQLIQQIEQLSPEGQAQLAEYVMFLIWQEEQKQAQEVSSWSFSFVEAFKKASIHSSQDPAGMDVKMAPATVGGETQMALWAHPPLMGQTIIEYHVPIPQKVDLVRLKVAFGIRDGSQIAEDNLVAFSIRVNGLRVWGEQTNTQYWQPADIPLSLPAGDIARIELTTETLGSHEWTWAVWGSPELVGR
jgi:hypothetical protein